ncbi:LysR family transcriptional regulator [Pelomonas sp. KK5]|uniref:LysR family transcriptional regulator n=1 Tax=Pelomonas sp. KK5 TaxID=1855730 RepID=UPI00097BAA6B|nr:LysR family transcriptional regulator [Pelomonas sp. KK5]
MRFKKLDLNLLVALDAMLEERNISRAAERMHLSQSAMSNALARLRDYFEDELLVPVGRRMDLTPRAESLREAVKDVLARVNTTIATLPEFDPASSDRCFKFFVSDYTTATLIPYLIERAWRQAPGVSFELLPQASHPHQALEQGEIDVLIIPEGYCSPEHPTELLFTESFCCVTWQGSRWAHERVDLDAYCAAGHVIVTTGREHKSYEEMFMQRRGIQRRVEIQTTSFVATSRLVIGTDRIATVHRRLANEASRHYPVAIQPVPVDVPPMRQAVQWHKYRSMDPGLVWLRGLLHEAVAAMDADLGAPAPPLPPVVLSSREVALVDGAED